jgi:hypothetical protein
MLDHTLTTQNGTCLIRSAATKVTRSDVRPGMTDKTTDSKRRQPRYIPTGPVNLQGPPLDSEAFNDIGRTQVGDGDE